VILEKEIKDYYLSELVELRNIAREEKDWELSDKIRDYLDTKNVFIFDSPDGQIIYYELAGTTRQDVIDKTNTDKRLNKIFDAWLYSTSKEIKND